MAGKTVTRADLCEAVYQKVGLSRTESSAFVELVLKEITDCLEKGETVKLSSFGSFVVRKKGERVGRNPKTGDEVPISPRRVMVFKPSTGDLKHRLNSGPDGARKKVSRRARSGRLDKAPDAFRTISEVADDLDIPQHVLRFWETRFAQIKPMKRGGGRRYYRPDDVDLLRGIRHLLYGEGYTIRGVQRILKDHGVKFVQSVWRTGAPQPPRVPGETEEVESDVGEVRARSRGLFGLLPARREQDTTPHADEGEPEDEAEIEAPVPPREIARPATPPPPTMVRREEGPEPVRENVTAAATLPRTDLRKLQAALHELTECRRLIDAALLDDR